MIGSPWRPRTQIASVQARDGGRADVIATAPETLESSSSDDDDESDINEGNPDLSSDDGVDSSDAGQGHSSETYRKWLDLDE
ncbi:hypothetical protein ACEPPN_000754 [Leptodophora sp. 'Broadleaf-Isolate-01']